VTVLVFSELNKATEDALKKTKLIEHPNLVKILGHGQSKMIKNGKEKTESDFYIVSELCQNGELFDYVYKANGLSENICRQLFK